eukprot:Nitzschia sp. Nitz4//scaffold6_size259037//4043//5666//NITZ4_001036-RA/size259037-snap-gene-0.389-mRNA-1//-1//CDS//3329556779//6738//frame0
MSGCTHDNNKKHMRFAIATAGLVQVLPVVSFDVEQHMVHQLLRRDSTPASKLDAFQKQTLIATKTTRSLVSSSGILPSRRTLYTSPSGTECNPDVGILSCGIGKYCKSDDVVQPGVCTTISTDPPVKTSGHAGQKSYYGSKFCESTNILPYYCDCSDWDVDAHTGSATCNQIDNMCAHFCPSLCLSQEMVYLRDPITYSWRSTICVYYSKPYEQNFCTTVYDDNTCKLSLDSIECSSCDLEASDCGTFDCTNVGMNSGNFCDFPPVPPIGSSTCGEPRFAACDICGGSGVLIPDAQYYFPPQHMYHDCVQAYWKGVSGFYWDDFDCWYMKGLMGRCCTSTTDTSPTTAPSTPEPTMEPTNEACDICDGRGFLVPNAQYYFPPTHSRYNCSQAYEKGISGVYWDDFDCWYMKGLMGRCCTGATVPPTTSSPTSIPATREATTEPTVPPTNTVVDETNSPSTIAPTNESTQDAQIDGATGTVPNQTSSVSKLATHVILGMCVVFGAIFLAHNDADY